MRRILAAVTFVLLAEPLFAIYTDIELFVPVVGHGHQTGGRIYDTTLWITNPGDAAAHVRLQFLRASQPNPSPRFIDFAIAPGATRLFDPVGAEILGAPEGVGAIRLHSDHRIVASARAVSRAESEPAGRAIGTTINAIPARFAIGNGQTAIAQGAKFGAGADRYRLYVVETAGRPLTYVIGILDANGAMLAQKAFYVANFEPRVIDVGDEFPNIHADHAVVRLRGINGNGRIVFTGAAQARESQDSSSFEMTFVNEPRLRIPLGEMAVYVTVAAAIIVAAVVYRR